MCVGMRANHSTDCDALSLSVMRSYYWYIAASDAFACAHMYFHSVSLVVHVNRPEHAILMPVLCCCGNMSQPLTPFPLDIMLQTCFIQRRASLQRKYT